MEISWGHRLDPLGAFCIWLVLVSAAPANLPLAVVRGNADWSASQLWREHKNCISGFNG